MAERIIASGDARPIPTAGGQREHFTTGERFCHLEDSPEIASLVLNEGAPTASLIALGRARTLGALGIFGVVSELALPTSIAMALDAARDDIEEVLSVLGELQRRATQRGPGAQS